MALLLLIANIWYGVRFDKDNNGLGFKRGGLLRTNYLFAKGPFLPLSSLCIQDENLPILIWLLRAPIGSRYWKVTHERGCRGICTGVPPPLSTLKCKIKKSCIIQYSVCKLSRGGGKGRLHKFPRTMLMRQKKDIEKWRLITLWSLPAINNVNGESNFPPSKLPS